LHGDLEVGLLDAGHLDVHLVGVSQVDQVGSGRHRVARDVRVHQRVDPVAHREQFLNVARRAVLLDLHGASVAPVS